MTSFGQTGADLRLADEDERKGNDVVEQSKDEEFRPAGERLGEFRAHDNGENGDERGSGDGYTQQYQQQRRDFCDGDLGEKERAAPDGAEQEQFQPDEECRRR